MLPSFPQKEFIVELVVDEGTNGCMGILVTQRHVIMDSHCL